jgi:FkbH-like protein
VTDKILRQQLREVCAANDLTAAQTVLCALLKAEPSTAAASFAQRQVEGMEAYQALQVLRIGILASFTAQPLTPHLALQQFIRGRRLEVEYWPYHQWFSTLAQKGDLDRFDADVVLLLLHLEDVAPLLALRHLAERDRLEEERSNLMNGLEGAISGFRQRSSKPIILNTFIAARRGVERHFDRMVHPSRTAFVEILNSDLADLAQRQDNVSILDYAGLVADIGRDNWFDPVKNDLNKAAITSQSLPRLAMELSDHLEALENPRCKVVAVDLDNTLWGGIIGEDGAKGIAIGGDYPGNAYESFQSFLANLRASGVLLVMVSKNNLEDAQEAFAENPLMPLQWHDFSSHRVNWIDKAANIRSAATEINLGTDAFMFIDDSPMECDLVRSYLPGVRVVELSGPPSLFADKLMAAGALDAVRLTNEDFARAVGYQAETKRSAHRAEASDISDFLAGLELRLKIGPPVSENVERIVQLFNKTNQFNLTTKRYGREDVINLLADANAEVIIAQLSDRFGDYGLIAVVVLRHDEEATNIDSLLMSCRALGRNVEEALIAFIEERARARGARRLVGFYHATAKNELVADLYPRFGLIRDDDDTSFVRELQTQAQMSYPAAVYIEKTSEE